MAGVLQNSRQDLDDSVQIVESDLADILQSNRRGSLGKATFRHHGPDSMAGACDIQRDPQTGLAMVNRRSRNLDGIDNHFCSMQPGVFKQLDFAGRLPRNHLEPGAQLSGLEIRDSSEGPSRGSASGSRLRDFHRDLPGTILPTSEGNSSFILSMNGKEAQCVSSEHKQMPKHSLKSVSSEVPPFPFDTRGPTEYRKKRWVPSSERYRTPSSCPSLQTLESKTVKQPLTRPISEQQLINEVKGIYAGLVMVERKCVDIIDQQTKSNKCLTDQQWKSLVAIHRTLLQEHDDFFSASQHPTASENLKRLAAMYAMPARMWRHGIHAFLELLRHRSYSTEHMLSFIYLAYSMMTLLKESVLSFNETWIECLGDLAKYKMAMGGTYHQDREIRSDVAKMWYNEASDSPPDIDRIQHHLAILARSNIVEELFSFDKALRREFPFASPRNSIMLLFNMFSKGNTTIPSRIHYSPTEYAFVYQNALLFTRRQLSECGQMSGLFKHSFAGHMNRSGARFKIQGPRVAEALFAGLLDFGKEDTYLWSLYFAALDGSEAYKTHSSALAHQSSEAGFKSDGPLYLVTTRADVLNKIGRLEVGFSNIETNTFPPDYGGHGIQLPENFKLRGIMTTIYYRLPSFFAERIIDKAKRYQTEPEPERVLTCKGGKWHWPCLQTFSIMASRLLSHAHIQPLRFTLR